MFEISAPIIIVLILLLMRNVPKEEKMSDCNLIDKRLSSVGVIPFFIDLFCNFLTKCNNHTIINWNMNDTNTFLKFVYNISQLYSSFSTAPYSSWGIWRWSFKKQMVDMLMNTEDYLSDIVSPLVDAVDLIMYGNQSDYDKGMNTIKEAICGSSKNDGETFLDFTLNPIDKGKTLNKSNENKTCQEIFRSYFDEDIIGRQLYDTLAPLIFGKIYYTPDSKFTRELVRRANFSFAVLDTLRLAALEWRVKFKDQFEKAMNTNWIVTNVKEIAQKCIDYPYKFAKACKMFLNRMQPKSVKSFVKSVSFLFSLIERGLKCANLNKFVPVKEPLDISYLEYSSMTNVFAGVIFDESTRYLTKENASLLKYQIRISTNRINTNKFLKVSERFWTDIPRLNIKGNLKYYTSGFLFLQESIDRAFIELVTNKTLTIGASVQLMPYPCYVYNKLVKSLYNIVPFILFIAWAPSFIILLQQIAFEKQIGLKQFKSVMGLSSRINWLGKFVSTMTVLIFPIIIMSVTLKYGKILYFSSVFIIGITLISFVISLICQAFMISAFFDNANLATICGGILYLVFYLPFLAFIKSEDPLHDICIAWKFCSQVSFCNTINLILFWENLKNGVHFSNLFSYKIQGLKYGVGHCILFMWLDSFIYILIMWYVGSVFPGRYGIPKPWHFILWRECTCSFREGVFYQDQFPVKSIPKIDISQSSDFEFEEEPPDLNLSIRIHRLMKIFSKSSEPVVNDLTLNIYESQITALLGHNNAGKTTTVSILTGLLPPTSGSAFILNLDIRNNIKEIRRNIGFCPQENILFNNLTVEDHLYFYGALKGISGTQTKKVLNDFGLSTHCDTLARNLSCGMKRKLSVSISFIGNSRVIILDEPTAGVDSTARKKMWDVILNYRTPDNTIILITQDMEEADYLSDRIAFMVYGKLRCCGSPSFLKEQYSIGYKLVLFKDPNFIKADPILSRFSADSQEVFLFMRKYINDAKLLEESDSQWTINLPRSNMDNEELSNFFKNLDSALKSLNIYTYELFSTSLEDVFLKVCVDSTKAPIYVTKPSKITYLQQYFKIIPKLSQANKTLLSKIDNFDYQSLESLFKFNKPSRFIIFYQQLVGFHIMKFHNLKRNFNGFIVEIILPILFILMTFILYKISYPNHLEESMTIHPWLMLRNRTHILNTFFRREEPDDGTITQLTDQYTSDLGESGVRCMNSSVYKLKKFPCVPIFNSKWKPQYKGVISLITAECHCDETGRQQCTNNQSGNPETTYRVMASTNKLYDLKNINLSDYLIKKYQLYSDNQFGGYQFTIRSFINEAFNAVIALELWHGLRRVTDDQSDPEKYTFINLFKKFLTLSGKTTTYSRIWVNSKGYISMPSYLNIFNNVLLRLNLDPSISMNYGIVVENHPFNSRKLNLHDYFDEILFHEVSMTIFVIIGLSLIPSSFVILLIEERVSGFKQQQFASGMNVYIYWISNFYWDLIKYIFSILLLLTIFMIFEYYPLIGDKNLIAFCLLLLCYGFSIIPFIYTFSLLLSTPSNALVVLFIYNFLLGSIATMSTFFMDLLQKEKPTLIRINKALKNLFVLFPQYNLCRGTIDLSFNYIQYDFTDGRIDYNPLGYEITGEKLISLISLSCFWWLIFIYIERKEFYRILKCLSRNQQTNKVIKSDKEVEKTTFQEKIKQIFLPSSKQAKAVENGLKLNNLTKSYKQCFYLRNKGYGVKNVSFDVNEGECLGLIGLNGSGKSTIYKTLIGEESITSGDAIINGISINKNKMKFRKNIGFCPQFDTYTCCLTCEELLRFYCRIRGESEKNITLTVGLILKYFNLAHHSKKLTYELSNGNKRKLSLAIAMIGFQSLYFLDDPTCCLDLFGKASVWNLIQKVTAENGRSFIFVSNNMKECEVLCNKILIMTNGEVKSQGTIAELKTQFGNDFIITLKIPHNVNKVNVTEKLNISIREQFQQYGTILNGNAGLIQIQISPIKIYEIFEFVENLKKIFNIIDYSISHITLDEIFNYLAK